ncbi:superoxide dismutase family protein [Litorimonas sp. RW-G-Af-16]|uniref:superoxide dismutase family protein n=1 Tax=Litorimonas sp. RW-G-Af-16 TaxID=3241168 RepID=UPI00390C6A9C
MPYVKPLSLTLTAILALSACSSQDTASDSPMTIEQPILSTIGNQLGTVTLRDLGADGTEVKVTVTGISEGSHAMHFHETGKCEGPDYASAGGHYNPTNAAHGTKMANGPHAGDMMNIDVMGDLTGQMTVINERVSINGDHGLPPLLDGDGTALIIHEKADDYESQPSGAAGARIGCAVISAN